MGRAIRKSSAILFIMESSNVILKFQGLLLKVYINICFLQVQFQLSLVNDHYTVSQVPMSLRASSI